MPDYKAAGYTHRIRWLEYNPLFGIYIEKSFPTTSDAVSLHMESLNKRRSEDDEDNIVGIRSELLQ